MKAVLVRAPGQFGVEELPTPTAPAGGLLLKVEACALCGSDLRTLRIGHRKVALPWVIGHEICGIVAETGPGYAGGWSVGDKLSVGPLAYCGVCDFCAAGQFELCESYREIGQTWPGGLADYIAIPEACVRLGTIRKVDASTDPALAAVAEPVSSCVNAQEKGNVGLGDTVVIIGAGPIGCIHACLARVRGAAKVILADVSAERLELATPFGPDHIVNSGQTNLVTEVRRLTHDKGADVVVTANPVPATQVQAVEMCRKGGRVLLFGGLPVDQSRPGVDMNLVHYNALHLLGTTIFAPRHQQLALQLIESGRIPVAEFISRFPLVDFGRGANLALEGKITKAVFLP